MDPVANIHTLNTHTYPYTHTYTHIHYLSLSVPTLSLCSSLRSISSPLSSLSQLISHNKQVFSCIAWDTLNRWKQLRYYGKPNV